MSGRNTWLTPLTGAAFVVVGIVGFVIAGEPKSVDDPVREIVDFYVENDDQVMVGSMLTAVAGALLIFFAAYLRAALRVGDGERDALALVSFIGLTIVAIGLAIDATISFALAEAAEDIDPSAVQALQALWENDFIPMMMGIIAFLWATGIAILRGAPLPRWLGWLMIVLGIVAVTPLAWAAAIGTALIVLALSIVFALRDKARPATPPPSAPSQAASGI